MAVISPALAGLAVSHLESSVLERLVFALRDGEPAVRDAAVVSLRKYPQAVGPLVKTMTEDRNPAAREAAARTLASGCSPDPTSTAGLVRALSDDDAAVRRAAADALASQGRIPTATDERLLYLRAKQDWKSLRQFGATAVGQLVPLLKDRDEAVRLAAVRLLGSLRAREVAADVGNLLSDPSQEVRRQTAAVIATIGDASLVGSLRAALAREGFDDVRQEIENAIRRLDRK
jgi:HEAT repeat protein